MQVIYLDKLFLISFTINYMLLFATKRVLNANASNARLILGTIICTLYTLMFLIPYTDFVYSLTGKLVFSLVLVATTYGIRTPQYFIKMVGAFYILTFAFGGFIYAIASFAGISYFKNDSLYLNMPMKILLASTVAAYAAIMFFTQVVKKNKKDAENIAELKIIYQGEAYTLPCLHDTGNSLKEPISGEPVILVEKDIICDIADEKKRIIPYKSIGGDGVISAFKADKVYINQNEVENVYIGLWKGRFATDGRYKGLY